MTYVFSLLIVPATAPADIAASADIAAPAHIATPAGVVATPAGIVATPAAPPSLGFENEANNKEENECSFSVHVSEDKNARLRSDQ